ncbi:MAG: hypothetical protein ABFS18_11215 [Thermodesulfobacteriota bacterium]
MKKVHKTEIDVQKSIRFLMISCALILLNIEAIPIAEITKKAFGVPFSSEPIAISMLWLLWIYLLLQFIHSCRVSQQNIFGKIAKEFGHQLAKYSHKMKNRIDPELYTPQYLVTQKSRFKLCWECKYCQAMTNDLEPSITIQVSCFPVIRLSAISTVKVLLDLPVFLYLVIPAIAGILSLLFQLNNFSNKF